MLVIIAGIYARHDAIIVPVLFSAINHPVS